uniref:Poly(ADP-ribose) polymerase family member 11 n=1 Tax=Cyprinodon variegatus TaxID=28743 RepID=A0A3Q2CQT2_CYPVA
MSSLGEVEDMDTWDTPWYWYYLEDCGRWHRFESSVQSKSPETLYRNAADRPHHRKAKKNPTYDFLQSESETITLTDVALSYSCSCSCSPPIFWEQFNPMVPYQLIPLSKLTPEYKTVASYTTNEGRLSSSIVSISRIQNLDLWEIFCRFQRDTVFASITLIYGYLKLMEDHMAMVGSIYFAVEALYAGRYSSNSTTSQHNGNTKPIFLARVLVGKFKLGRSSMQKPDDENQYLSCVNDINHPKIFVIFDPNQIYPEYLIEYQ